MNSPVLVRCVSEEGPPPLPWAHLASRLAAVGPRNRVQAHPLGLAPLAADLGSGSREPGSRTALVVLDTEFPVAEAAAFVAAIAPTPVVLYGPYALDRFEQLPVRAAVLGPAGADLPTLLEVWCAHPDRVDDAFLGDHPGLLLRSGTGAFERWTATPHPGWPRSIALGRLTAAALDWSYWGPDKHRSAATDGTLALCWPTSFTDFATTEEREAAGRAARLTTELPPARFDPRWTAPSSARLQALLEQDPSARLYQLAAPTRKEAIAHLVAEIQDLVRLGHRTFAVSLEDPTPVLLAVLRELERRDAAPSRLVLSPGIQSLRRIEGIRQELHSAALLVGRLVVEGVAFHGFDDRGLGADGRPGTHWDQRWVARLLTELESSRSDRITSTRGHRLSLVDPFTAPPDIVASLAAIDEDGAFLKPLVHPGAFLPIPSRHGSLGRRFEAAGYLRPARTASGWGYDFADARLGAYLDRAQQGLGPLLESVGRLKLDPEIRAQAVVEARFRWMRQLAEHFERDREEDGESWGKVLAAVTREVALQMRRT